MHHCLILQIFLISSLLLTVIFGRALYYDELDEIDNTKSLSNDDDGKMNKRIFFIINCFVCF
jgi:hypothetical protein